MKNKIRIFALAMTDMALLNISAIAAFMLRFDGRLDIVPTDFFVDMQRFMVINIVLKMTCLYFFKLYSSLWRYASIYEMILIIGFAFFSNGAVLICKFIINIKIPGSMLVVITFIDIFLIGGVRFSYRVLRRINYASKILKDSTKRALIVGNGEHGAAVIKELSQYPELKIKPVAIVDEDIGKQGRKINGIPIIGQFSDIFDVVYKEKIDEIIITVPLTNNKAANQIYNECLKTGCKAFLKSTGLMWFFMQLPTSMYLLWRIIPVKLLKIMYSEP